MLRHSSNPKKRTIAKTAVDAPVTSLQGNEPMGNIDRYELLKHLGEGGFGAVYGARDTEADILVALKLLRGDISRNDGEMEEIRANFSMISRLNHPNIAGLKHLHRVQHVDHQLHKKVDVHVGDYMVVMEYAPGTSLYSWIHSLSDGKLPLDAVLQIIRPIAKALDYTHEQNIVHRDVNPRNIIISRDAKSIKLLDFGLAEEIESANQIRHWKPSPESQTGTPLYMPPEHWAGKHQDGRSDQYSLAVLTHELVSGRVPHKASFDSRNSESMLYAIFLKPIPKLPELNKHQNEIIRRALSKKPEDRFSSCCEFVNQLDPATASKKAAKRQQTSLLWQIFLLIAGSLIALALLLSYQFIIEKSTEPASSDSKNVTNEQPVNTSDLTPCGNLHITTTPEALIQAKNTQTGETTVIGLSDEKGHISYNKLKEGPYQLTLSHADYATNSCNITISSAKPAQLQSLLKALPGSLLINSIHAAEVYENGKKIGQTDELIPSIKAGLHSISIHYAGQSVQEFELEIPPNDELELTLNAFAVATGTLKLGFKTPVAAQGKLDLSKATLMINGLNHEVDGSELTIKDLPEGQLELSFQHPDICPLVQKVDIKQNATQTINLDLDPKPALVSFKINAPDAMLHVNKQNISLSGQNLALPAYSKVQIRVSAPDHIPRTLTLPALPPGTKKEWSIHLKKWIGPKTDQEWQTTLENGAKMVFVPIAAGSYTMGNNDAERTERPAHMVTFKAPFWIGQTEVTQAQYKAIMGSNPSSHKGTNLPVEQVGWHDAMEFCRQLTTQELIKGRLTAEYEYTLPTEAQWEYACRAGSGPVPYSSKRPPRSRKGPRETVPVDQGAPNDWGLYNMLGNVWEWCLDDWYDSYKGAPENGSRRGYGHSTSRARRGGSWLSASVSPWRSTARAAFASDRASHDLGFRIVLIKR